MAEKEFTLTEWDFDMPRNNRFHDPIQPQKNVSRCGEENESENDSRVPSRKE